MASKKAGKSPSKAPSLQVEHRTELAFEVDAVKIAAIKRCLETGTLRITMSKVDLLTGGRSRGGYIYD